jgi:hypothetical protein
MFMLRFLFLHIRAGMLFMTFSAFYDLWERGFLLLFYHVVQKQTLFEFYRRSTNMNSTKNTHCLGAIWLTLCLITWKKAFAFCCTHHVVVSLMSLSALRGDDECVNVEQLFSNITCQRHPGNVDPSSSSLALVRFIN